MLIALVTLTACPSKDGGTKPATPNVPQYDVITGEKHDIGLGVYEYKLLINFPKDKGGDQWIVVNKSQYDSCTKTGVTYPECTNG